MNLKIYKKQIYLKIFAINAIKIIIILMKNYIFVMNVILIYAHYVNISMIKIIISLIIMIKIIYAKSIMKII